MTSRLKLFGDKIIIVVELLVSPFGTTSQLRKTLLRCLDFDDRGSAIS